MTARKIVHIDMDAFYASVEQRDDPQLRGKPVIVAWVGKRSVVCAASYEARRFGVRSAMPAIRAQRLCPDGVFVPPDFPRYRAVSHLASEIFKRHTDLVEPLSLDEAYLDVTINKTGLPTATRVAQTIREQIREELKLTASAGVAPNKFLAKIASDWRKPDGLFVIKPEDVDTWGGEGDGRKAQDNGNPHRGGSAQVRFTNLAEPLRPLRCASPRVGSRHRRKRSNAGQANAIRIGGGHF